jgi:hypothetical protein
MYSCIYQGASTESSTATCACNTQLGLPNDEVPGRFAPNPVRPLSRFAPNPVRPYSRSPRVVSPRFINSALKNEIWKIGFLLTSPQWIIKYSNVRIWDPKVVEYILSLSGLIVITSKLVLRSPPWFDYKLRNMCRSPRVVSPRFINSALKNEIWKIPF